MSQQKMTEMSQWKKTGNESTKSLFTRKTNDV